LSRFPVAFRPPAFASRSSDSRRGIRPPSRSAYRPNSAGPRRDYRVPHARATTGLGALSTPRTTVLIPTEDRPQPASAAPPRLVLTPRYNLHPAGLRLTRHQRGFKQFTRPIFPSPVAPGWNGNPWAFPRASNPAGQEPDDARRGGDRPPSTDPKQRSRHQPRLQSACLLVYVRHRVAPVAPEVQSADLLARFTDHVALAEEYLVGIPTGRLVLCAVTPVRDCAARG
jgi:hypothetical protein